MARHPLEKFRFCPLCGSDRFVENNNKSKRCEACGFVYYFNPSASTVAVIVNEKNELLVVRRAKEPAKGTLDLPGGFSDCYETSEEGVVREVKEETGLTVEKIQFLFSIPNIYPYGGLDIHTIDMFYLCHVNSTKNAIAADDAAEIMWIPWNEVRPETFGLTSIRKGVQHILAKKIPNI
ncbi:MAG: NUDIX domain-containing protein [Bacteroidaceae bacterium]|nr:NUDIX domain-containing protein [Bacteroidaceae bacterium]